MLHYSNGSFLSMETAHSAYAFLQGFFPALSSFCQHCNLPISALFNLKFLSFRYIIVPYGTEGNYGTGNYCATVKLRYRTVPGVPTYTYLPMIRHLKL